MYKFKFATLVKIHTAFYKIDTLL